MLLYWLPLSLTCRLLYSGWLGNERPQPVSSWLAVIQPPDSSIATLSSSGKQCTAAGSSSITGLSFCQRCWALSPVNVPVLACSQRRPFKLPSLKCGEGAVAAVAVGTGGNRNRDWKLAGWPPAREGGAAASGSRGGLNGGRHGGGARIGDDEIGDVETDLEFSVCCWSSLKWLR